MASLVEAVCRRRTAFVNAQLIMADCSHADFRGSNLFAATIYTKPISKAPSCEELILFQED